MTCPGPRSTFVANWRSITDLFSLFLGPSIRPSQRQHEQHHLLRFFFYLDWLKITVFDNSRGYYFFRETYWSIDIFLRIDYFFQHSCPVTSSSTFSEKHSVSSIAKRLTLSLMQRGLARARGSGQHEDPDGGHVGLRGRSCSHWRATLTRSFYRYAER